MPEKLSPEQTARLLRAKANELENQAAKWLDNPSEVVTWHGDTLAYVLADIALVARLLADHIERQTSP